jgi:hypothetical protein
VRAQPERTVGAPAEAQRCPARWAEPVPRPSALGLVVAALVGTLAAGSWTLSTWVTLGRAASPPDVILEPAETAVAAALLAAQSPNTNE